MTIVAVVLKVLALVCGAFACFYFGRAYGIYETLSDMRQFSWHHETDEDAP